MLLGLLRFTNALGGTADFIYPGPSIDMQSPASAGAVNGTTYLYYAQSLDMTEWERGSGVYTSSSGTFARTTITANSLGTTAKVNFTNRPQVIVFDSGASVFGKVATRKYTSSGTYTPTAGMLYCIIECQAGGGSGGAVVFTSGRFTAGAGGGGGAYARAMVSAASVGASQTVTVGAGGAAPPAGANNGANGGTSSVGGLCSADGGLGGSYGQSGVSIGPGAAGGTTGSGDIVVPGGPGGGSVDAVPSSGQFFVTGWGGSSFFGGGAACAFSSSGIAATAGSGGGGSGGQDLATGNKSGGAGGSGLVIITEFCSQ